MGQQHDMVIDNANGAAFRADLNLALLALVSQSYGDTAPSTTYPFQFWADTTNDLLKIRNEANSAWITIGSLTAAYLGLGALAVQNQWTKLQRCGVVTDNDGAFDLTGAAGNLFTWTPTGADVLDFTNEVAGAHGVIYLDNSSGYAITLGGEVIGPSTLAADLSTAGKYEITFRCYNGTNVVCQHSEAVA